jgi:hypothetical protein
MRGLEDLLVQLAALVPTRFASWEAQVMLEAAGLDVSFPIESRIVLGDGLQASLPRGRLSTGFDPPLGRVVARFEVQSR